MGPRAMPSQVPIIPDQSLEEQRKAREFFRDWDKPFLSVFAGDDPVTKWNRARCFKYVSKCKKCTPYRRGHFFQWTRSQKLSEILIDFIKEE